MVSAEVQLLQNLHVLKDLQAGRIDRAKEMLEQRIDVGVVHLDFLKKEHKELQKEPFSSLPAVAEYRSSAPYRSQDDRVTRILEAFKK